MTSRGEASTDGIPSTLRIRFAAGERPHAFWVSGPTPTARGTARIKVLSKRAADHAIHVVVIEDPRIGRARGIASISVPSEAPAGWLDHWVQTLARDLDVGFERFDVSSVESVEEWRRVARSMGWTHP